MFDCEFDSYEVWAKRFVFSGIANTAAPAPRQTLAASSARARSSTYLGQVLDYQPYRILHSPVTSRASRFIFPEFLVASQSTLSVHIFNVITGEIVEGYSLTDGIDMSSHPERLHRSIHYVEFSSTHIFVCVGLRLVVYARSPTKEPDTSFTQSSSSSSHTGPWVAQSHPSLWPKAKVVLRLPDDLNSIRDQGDIALSAWSKDLDMSWTVPLSVEEIMTATGIDDRPPHPGRAFCAVHVAPDGASFVAVTQNGLLFYAQDVLSASSKAASTSTPTETTVISEVPTVSKEGNKRLLIFCMNTGIDNLAYDGQRACFSAVSLRFNFFSSNRS